MSIRLIFIFIFLNYLSLQAQVQLNSFTKDDVLTSNQITCYFVDSKGLVWIGTESGLNAYSGGKWYPIKSISNEGTGKEDQLGRVEKIYEDRKRNVWVSTANGLFLYNGNLWVHFLPEEGEKLTVKDFMEDRLGRIWFGLENKKEFKEISKLQITIMSGIVYMYNYENWYRFAEMSGSVALNYNIPYKYFTPFLIDRAGSIWIGSLEGLFQFNDDKLIDIEEDDLRFIKIFGVIQSKSGIIWVATEKGIYRFDDGKWLNYAKKDGLSGDFFYDIKEDPSGRIWAFSAIDMRFTGLSMWDGNNWQQFDNDAIHLKGSIDELIWWENEILAFSTDGVARYDSSGWHRFDRKDGLTDKKYSLMVRDRHKNIWLAGEKSFYQYHNKKWIKLFEPDDDWVVNEIVLDKKGSLWIAADGSGAFEFSNNKWEHYSEENGLPDNNVSGIFEDKTGEIWFITKKGIAKTSFLTE